MDSEPEIVDGVAKISNEEDKDSIKVLFEPAVVVFFFENGVVEVGVSGRGRGRGVSGKSLEVHGGVRESIFEGLILFLIGKSCPRDLFDEFSRDWVMIIFRLIFRALAFVKFAWTEWNGRESKL